MQTVHFIEETQARSALDRAAKILGLIAGALCLIWIAEVVVARGPLEHLFGSAFSSITTIMAFSIAFSIGVRMVMRHPVTTKSYRLTESSKSIGRFGCAIAVTLTLAGLVSGQSDYNPLLADAGRNASILGFVWAPASLGAGALIFSQRGQLRRLDWLWVVLLVIVTSQVGGRTIPGALGIMIILRVYFLSPGRKSISPRSSMRTTIWIGIAVALAAVALSASAAIRSDSGNSSAFGQENLEYYGYDFGPAPTRYLLATVGVIGESSRITHGAVPAVMDYAGPNLLLSDVLSFLPWYSSTVTASTIDVYRAAGSVVFVSRPGGTPNTFYIMGGNWLTTVGGLVYGLVLSGFLRRSVISGSAVSRILFLILGTTFMLGVYGTGTPTALTLLGAVYAVTLNFFGKLGGNRCNSVEKASRSRRSRTMVAGTDQGVPRARRG